MPGRTQKKGNKKMSGGNCDHHKNAIKKIIGTARPLQNAGTRKK